MITRYSRQEFSSNGADVPAGVEEMNVKFYVIGDVTVDHLYHLNHLPTPGEEVAPSRATMEPGGAGGTISVTLARLGHSVILAARVGDDPFAEYALVGRAATVGSAEAAMQRDPEHLTSTITVMQTPDGQRAMISDGAANRELDPAKLKKKDVEGSRRPDHFRLQPDGGPQREYCPQGDGAAKNAKTVPVFIDLGTGAVNAVGRANWTARRAPIT